MAAVAGALAGLLAALVAPARGAQEEPPPIVAAPVVLATSGAPWAAFSDPAGCAAGFVVAHARGRDGRDALLTSSGGPARALAQAGSVLTTDDGEQWIVRTIGVRPSVNARYHVAFTAGFEGGGSGLVVADGFSRRFELVADSSEAFRDFGAQATIDERGAVAFQATLDPPGHPDRTDGLAPVDETLARQHPELLPAPTRETYAGRRASFESGLFVEDGRAVAVIGSTRDGLLDFDDGFARSAAGALAWRESRRRGQWSLVVRARDLPRTLATTGPALARLGPPALSDAGRVAWVAWDGEGRGALRRASLAGGPSETLVAAQAGFVDFAPGIALDSAGRIAFVGTRADGSGALALIDGKRRIDVLLELGAPLADSTVSAVRLGTGAFLRTDRLALVATLADGREALLLLYLRR